jgi:hypothetical protein
VQRTVHSREFIRMSFHRQIASPTSSGSRPAQSRIRRLWNYRRSNLSRRPVGQSRNCILADAYLTQPSRPPRRVSGWNSRSSLANRINAARDNDYYRCYYRCCNAAALSASTLVIARDTLLLAFAARARVNSRERGRSDAASDSLSDIM